MERKSSYDLDPKYIQTIDAEKLTIWSRNFKATDKEKKGFIKKEDLLALLHSIGHRDLKEEDVDKLYKDIKVSQEGMINYQEYLELMKKLTEKESNTVSKKIVSKTGKELIQMKTGDSIRTFSEEERSAFTKVINEALEDDEVCKKYLPINPDNNELFTSLKNGILLCKLVNKVQEGTIDPRVINIKDNMNVFLQAENIILALSACKSLGFSVVSVNKETFLKCEESSYALILGVLWQIVKNIVLSTINLKQYPELIRLLNEGEQLGDLLKLSPEDLLKRWFNYHLKKAEYDKKLTNFSTDIKDSEKYIILLNQLNKDKCDKSGLQESDLKKRAEKVINNAKKLGAESYIQPMDIVKGNSKLNILFTASIFNSCPGLEPPTEQEKVDAAKLLDDDIEGMREERAFRNWINSLEIPLDNGELLYINNLYEESKTGINLLKVMDKINPGCVNWKIVDKKCKNNFSTRVNCEEVIKTAQKIKYKTTGVVPQFLHEGNKKSILTIVWQMMRDHSLKMIGNKSEADLVNWANSKVDEKYKIKDLKTKALKDSMFFIEIMKSIEPRIINSEIIITDKTDDDSLQNNAKYAISVARKLGAVVFIVWEDITQCKSKLLLTFLASLYDISTKYKPV